MKGAGPARRRTSSISALIVSLIVVSSVFSGAVSISIPVLAKGSNAFKMVTPTTQTKTTQLRDRPDTTNNNNYNNLFTSNTPSLIDNNNISSSIKHSELGEQTLRSDSVHSQLKRPTLWFGSDNTSSSSQDSNTRANAQSSAIRSSTQASTSGTGSQFSGTHDTEWVTYHYFQDKGEQNSEQDTITAHSVYTGTLSGGPDDYQPTPGEPMGSCDVVIKSVVLTGPDAGNSNTQSGHLDLVGYDGTIPPFPKASVRGQVTVDHTQKTIGMGVSVPGSSYCYGGLGGPGLVPYNENNGVLTASGGDSLSERIPSECLPACLPDGHRTETNQWSVTIDDTCPAVTSSAPPNDMNTISPTQNPAKVTAIQSGASTLEGSIILDLGTRGLIPVKGLKVELTPPGSATYSAYTDDFGNFKIDLPTNSCIKEALLRFTLSNQEKTIEVNYQQPNNPVFAETKINLSGPNTVADFKLQGSSIILNNDPLAFVPSQNMNIPVDKIPDLTAIYHYTSLAMDFAKKSFPDKINFNLPLEVVGFSTRADIRGASFFIVDPGPPIQKPTLSVKSDKSSLAKDTDAINVEVDLDSLYHEFGHFIVYEYSRVLPNNPDVSVHPNLRGFITPANCHLSYAHLTSQCSFNEAIGNFLSAVISQNVFTDPGHLQFGNNAKIFRSSSTDSVNLEKDRYDNPAGERDETGSRFFDYDPNGHFEEWALSSLLWDLYDNSPKEVTQTPVGQFKDDVSMSLINLIRIITVNKVTSTQQLFDALQQDSVISRPQKNEINGIFASFGICKGLNNDLWCNRGETILSHGFTSWTALYEFDDFLGHHHKIFFTYPYVGTNSPNGRP